MHDEGLTVKVKKLYPDSKLPERSTEGSTGFDLFAYIREEEKITIIEERPKLVGTGIAIEIPRGYDAQIRPRSGLSTKGVAVPLGTVDSDYRGELKVTMYTVGSHNSFEIKHEDRIAQLVITRLAGLSLEETEQLSLTERGTKGFGSTDPSF